MEHLNEVYLLSKFDVSSFLMSGDIQIFKLVILLTLSSLKSIVILLTLGKPNMTLIVYQYYFEQVTVTLLSLGKTFGCKKQSKSSPFDKKFKNHPQDLAQVIFNDSVRGNQELAMLPS